MFTRSVLSMLLVCGGFLVASQAYAGDEEMRRVTILDVAKPSAQQVDDALFPPDILAMKKECAEMEKQGLRCQNVIPKSSLDSMQVTFARGSAELTKDAKNFLRVVGESLSGHKAYWKSVSIEGHTDTTGSDQVNQALSLRRAESVKTYLSTNYGLSNIETIGRGSEKLRDQDNPAAEVNRRVEFITNW